MIIQIYEVQTPTEARQLIAMGVDHIGSVILDADNWKSPTIKETVQAVARSGARSSLIPLFSDPIVIQRVIEYYQPDIIHFCQMLPDSRRRPADLERMLHDQKRIKEAFPEIRIMRSLPIPQAPCHGGASLLDAASLFEPISDYFLTDTLITPTVLPEPDQASGQQPVIGFIGITGMACDWSLARELVAATGIPVILAGGITPENVADGIRQVRPAGVDSCTGTNACDQQGRPIRFQKDMSKVKRLIEAARQAATI